MSHQVDNIKISEELINQFNIDEELNKINEEIIEKIDNISNIKDFYSTRYNSIEHYFEEKEFKAFEKDLNDSINNFNHLKKDSLNTSIAINEPNIVEFLFILRDILSNSDVLKLKGYEQHKNCSRYNHCLSVSYFTYVITKKLNLDYKSATRGAMLHDLFFYDWHEPDPTHRLHGFTHPKVALNNAINLFDLNDKEKDIIIKHMWPLTLKFPSYMESYIVTLVDKYCAAHEVINAFVNKIVGEKNG